MGNFAYVDVGGGSTEISLLHDGILAESHSFNIGTLRLLSGNVRTEEWNDMKTMLEDYAKEIPGTRVIGTGGNINKLFKLAKVKNGKPILAVEQLRDIYDQLARLSIEERKVRFNLKDDRADVIVPAGEIFLTVAKHLNCDEIIVPNISLADSIVDGLYRDMRNAE